MSLTEKAKARLLKDTPPELRRSLPELKHSVTGEVEKIRSGYSKLDTGTNGGFRLGGAYLIASVEKTGKSALIRRIVLNMVLDAVKVCVIDTEGSQNDILQSLASLYFDKEKKNISEDEKAKVQEALNEDLIYITRDNGDGLISNGEGALSVDMCITTMEEAIEQGAKVLVVDNVTPFASESGDSSYHDRIRIMAESIKLAKRCNVAVIVVGHVDANTQQIEMAGKVKDWINQKTPEKILEESIPLVKRPRATDIYGGSILTQFDGKFLLWRPYQNYDREDLQKITTLILDSQRDGRSGIEIELFYNGEKMVFEEFKTQKVSEYNISQFKDFD